MTRRFLGVGKVQVGLAIMAIFLIAAIIGQPLSQHVLGWTPYTYDQNALGAGPSAKHLLGTTSSGQDALSWLL